MSPGPGAWCSAQGGGRLELRAGMRRAGRGAHRLPSGPPWLCREAKVTEHVAFWNVLDLSGSRHHPCSEQAQPSLNPWSHPLTAVSVWSGALSRAPPCVIQLRGCRPALSSCAVGLSASPEALLCSLPWKRPLACDPGMCVLAGPLHPAPGRAAGAPCQARLLSLKLGWVWPLSHWVRCGLDPPWHWAAVHLAPE